MNEDAAQFLRFGISLPCTARESLQEIAEIPECFEKLELSGELIHDTANLRRESPLLSEFEEINFRNILPETLTGQLTQADGTIINEYKKQLRELFMRAHECGSSYVSIDPDWEALFSSEHRRRILDDVLRSTAGDREYYNITLAITVRIARDGVLAPEKSLEFLRSINNYRVKLVLDINPHELRKSQTDWQKVLKMFRFDTAAVRFCYPSELGNKLLYTHIEPFVEALKKWQQETVIYIAPSGRADFNELAETVKAINSESL